ncbi:MAG: hypothetical protein H6797_05385 [Candidatus Nomurabacteria bacterium]|nr:MAG: hypothetical protein H6797_05385 [Candidatus Nomurabacteria bacterium]
MEQFIGQVWMWYCIGFGALMIVFLTAGIIVQVIDEGNFFRKFENLFYGITNHWQEFLLGAVAILLFVSSVIPAPYAYFIVLRWVVCAASLGAIWLYLSRRRYVRAAMFPLIALLFNPIALFVFPKEAWMIIDIVAGFVFLVVATYDE